MSGYQRLTNGGNGLERRLGNDGIAWLRLALCWSGIAHRAVDGLPGMSGKVATC